MTAATQSTCQRLVVFVGGFDPRGARHYHQLFQKQAALQGAVDCTHYSVSARRTVSLEGIVDAPNRHSRWQVSDAGVGASEYVFFDWSAQVRSHWPRSLWTVISASLTTYRLVWAQRASLTGLRAELPNTLLSFVYPLLMWMVGLLLAVLLGWGTAFCIQAWIDVPFVVHYLCAMFVSALGLWGCSAIDRRAHVSWLLRIFNFARVSASAPASMADENARTMASWIYRRQLGEPGLEVVILGFSVGSVKALALLHAWQEISSERASSGDSAQRSGMPKELTRDTAPCITLLTLGNCIPLFTLMPGATQLRAWMHSIGGDARVYWADISSPGDSVSFAMCDLQRLAMPGGMAAPSLLNPRHMCTPRFHTLFTSATYRWLRRNKMRMHFQYLMASQQRGAYNFYSMLTTQGTVRGYVEKFLLR